MTVDDLVAQLREVYPRHGIMTHRTLAAHLGISNRQLTEVLQSGRGPCAPCDSRLGCYRIAPGQLDAWQSARRVRVAA
jgi:hypothetical protein